MNNISFSDKDKKTTKVVIKKDTKKIDYNKEILEIEKSLEKIENKYSLSPNTHVSNAAMYLRSSIESLKKLI